MLKYLKEKWNISSNFQLLIIFIVFAITGTTSAKLAVPLLELLNIYPSNFDNFKLEKFTLHLIKDSCYFFTLSDITYCCSSIFSIQVFLGV